jgi:hypothetical protein
MSITSIPDRGKRPRLVFGLNSSPYLFLPKDGRLYERLAQGYLIFEGNTVPTLFGLAKQAGGLWSELVEPHQMGVPTVSYLGISP